MTNQLVFRSQITSDESLRREPSEDPARALARPWLRDDVLVVYNGDLDENAWGTFDGPGGAFVEDDLGIANWDRLRLAQVCDKLRSYIQAQWPHRAFRTVQLDFLEMITWLWRGVSEKRRLGWARELALDRSRFPGAVAEDPGAAWESFALAILYRLAGAARTALIGLGGPRLQVTGPIFPTRLLWTGADGLAPWGMISYPTADGQGRVVAAQDVAERYAAHYRLLDAVLVQVYCRAEGVDAPKTDVPKLWPLGQIPLEAQWDYVAGNIHQALVVAALAGGKPTWVMMHGTYVQHSAFAGRRVYVGPADIDLWLDAAAEVTHRGRRASEIHVWDAIRSEGAGGVKPAVRSAEIAAWLDGKLVAGLLEGGRPA